MPNRTIPSRGPLAEVLARCGEFGATVSIDRAPERVRMRLRAQLLSVLAMTFAAESIDEARHATAWAKRSSGPHPVLGSTHRASRMEAVVASIIRARSGGGEWALLGRPGAPACVVALCLGAAMDLSWRDLENAQLAAVELAARFGLATVLGPHLFEDAPCVAAVAGAVAAARVMGLSPERMTEAIARALGQPQLSPFRARGVSRAAASALDGMVAAELAFEGTSEIAVDTLGPLSFARGAFEGLGSTWLAETIHIDEHPGPVSVQTAIDAAREVAAQAHASRKAALPGTDIATITVETTLFGAAPMVRDSLARAVASTLQTTPDRVQVVHAWDLTSALLFRVVEAVDARALFADISLRELANAPALLSRIAEGLGLEAPPIAQLAADLTRALSRRAATGTARLAIPFANRVSLRTRNGERYAADRAVGRGSPEASDERVLSIARTRFLDAAQRSLGGLRAQRVYEAIVDPPSRQTVASFFERLVAERRVG